MTREERKLALYCLKASSDYHSEVCEECINYPNCDHTIQDDVTETIIEALEQEPCKDAISRQATIEAFQMFRGYESNRTNAEWVDRIETVVEKLPPVNPQEPKYCDRNICVSNEYNGIGCDECEVTKSQEPKTGRWIMTSDYLTTAYGSIDYVKCSCCGEDSLEEGDYCPNCGAKMESEVSND